MKRLLVVMAAALLVLTGYGQYIPGGIIVKHDSLPGLISRLNTPLPNNDRASVLHYLAYAYLDKKGEIKNNIDNGLSYSRQLAELANRMGSARYQQEALLLTALLRMEQQDIPGSEKLLPAMDDTTRLRALICLADICNRSAVKVPEERARVDLAARYGETALPLALRKKVHVRRTATALMNTAEQYRVRHLIPLSEKYYLLTLQCTPVGGFPSVAVVYSGLSIIYSTEGNFFKAMEYGKRAEKALTTKSTDLDIVQVYNCLGSLSAVQERPAMVLYYYGKILNDPRRYSKIGTFYGFVATYCANLQKLNRIDEVLPFLQKMQQLAPPQSNKDRYYVNMALGRCYRELRQFEQAEKYFLEGIQNAEKDNISTGAINYHLGILYFQFDQFEKAVATFKQAETNMFVENNPFIAMSYSYLAKAEAALGHHEAAYRYLLKSKTLSDSSFTLGRARLADELETQYEARKKEADLRIKEENIRVLHEDAAAMRQDALLKDAALKEAELLQQRKEIELQLREKDVEGLKKDKKLQDTIIRQAEVRKQVTLLIMGLLVVIVALLCWLFWSKAKSNKMITCQNGQLQQLVNDKVWLLKEMHHRVKNNLHTVVSLLELQSSHLQDDALQAIQHSQSRIFAMSLIHQKLYQANDTRTIDMAEYVPELVSYLDQSLNISRTIRILLDIDHTAFMVDEAVSLGLIINEAVTNAVKYAFSDERPGTISIQLKAIREEAFELVIADNGRGLQQDFDHEKARSLGFRLIKGLSEQLEASLSIANEDGLKITITGISAHRIDKVKAMEKELAEHYL